MKDLKSQKFGRLTVLGFSEIRKSNSYWHVKCNCGNKKVVCSSSLKSGHTKSCGCLNKEIAKRGDNNRTHGMIKTRFYRMWRSMKQRCLNKKNIGYRNYGGRGVACNEWLKFENFKDDMYESYLDHIKEFGEKQTQIDRRNNNGNYCKENCRFVTPQENSNNRRNNAKKQTRKKTSVFVDAKTCKEVENLIKKHGTFRNFSHYVELALQEKIARTNVYGDK